MGYFKGFPRLENFKIWAAFLFVFSSNLKKQQVNWGKDAQKNLLEDPARMLVNVHKSIENWLIKTTLKMRKRVK
jgi:hypothetical protein